MIRSQVYLTDVERKQLAIFSNDFGKSQSELIREAIDQFITNHSIRKKNKLAILQATKGLWKNREDLPNVTALRKEWDDHDSSE